MPVSRDVKLHTAFRVARTVDTLYSGGPLCALPATVPPKRYVFSSANLDATPIFYFRYVDLLLY
jgi:hypothetical protein